MRRVCVIPSHRAPDHVPCQLGSTNTVPPRGKGGNNTHNSQEVPYLSIDFGVGYPGVRTTFSYMATPSSCTPGFSIKWIFSEDWPRGPGTHRTLLQYPHGPVPEHCLALPGCTAAWGRSSVPIYPLGLDKTNFLRIPENTLILSSGRN